MYRILIFLWCFLVVAISEAYGTLNLEALPATEGSPHLQGASPAMPAAYPMTRDMDLSGGEDHSGSRAHSGGDEHSGSRDDSGSRGLSEGDEHSSSRDDSRSRGLSGGEDYSGSRDDSGSRGLSGGESLSGGNDLSTGKGDSGGEGDLYRELQQRGQATVGAIDSLTWQLYLEKDWTTLLRSARKAFREGIDFYYLRVRAGVAAYELKRLGTAVHHLEAARAAFPDDDFTNGTLYSSLVLAGREDEANLLASRLTPEARVRLTIPLQQLVNSLGTGIYLSRNSAHAALREETIAEEGSLTSYRSVLNRQWYKNVAFDLHLSPRFNLYTHLSHIAIDRTQHFSSTPNLVEALRATTTSQFQGYTQGRLLMGKGWSAFASASLLSGESNYDILSVTTPGLYTFTKESFPFTDWLINAGVARQMDWMAPRLSVTHGNINGWKQWQFNGQWVLYPLGNPDFYLVTEGYLHLDELSEHPKTIFTQKIALKTGPAWLIGEATRGTIANFSTGEGLVVYNMPERITSMTGATLWVPLFGYRLNAALRFLVTPKKGTTFVYTNATDYTVKHYRFNDHSLFISLQWNL